MKKLVISLLSILAIIIIISGIAIDRKTDSTNNELESSLMVYTTEDNAKMQFIAQQFKEATGITVHYKIVNNLNEAIKNESGNPQADVVYGGNETEFESMTQEGLLTPTAVSFSSQLNPEYINEKGYWYETSLEPIVMFYNSSYILPANAPTAWYQLGQVQYKDRIIIPNADQFVTQAALGATMYQYSKSQVPNQANLFLQGVRNNVLTYVQNEDDLIQTMQTSKEASISFAPLDVVKQAIANGATFNIVNPTDGSPMMMQGIGMVKGAKDPNSAKLFIEFLAGPNMQLKLADKFSMIPSISSVLPFAPAWMSNYNGLNISNIDWNSVTDNSDNLMSTFSSLVKSKEATNINLELPVIPSPLIPSQEKAKAEAAAKAAAEKAKQDGVLTPEEKAKKEAAEKAAKEKAAKEKLTQAQKAALESLGV